MTRSQLHTRLSFNENGGDIYIRLCADINIGFIWNVIVLVLDEQEVRWYWCIFETKCRVIAWYTMRNDTITTRIHYNNNDLSLHAHVDVDAKIK